MFEELGLNVARQPDNGANPRPDNRSGWLEGETPATPIDELIDRQDEANFWDPSTQLRVSRRRQKPPPYPQSGMTDVAERLEELRDRGLHRRLRLVSGPQGPRVLLDGRPVLLLCSNNYLGLADHPRVREAAAEAAMRWGAGAGASRLISGNMQPHRQLEERLAEFKGYEAALLFGSGYLANTGAIAALAGRGEVVFSDELNHASIIDGCRLSRAETFVYRHGDVEHLAWGLREAEGRGSLIVTDGVFSMDGDVAPLEELVELARRHDCRLMVDEAHATGALGPGGRGSVAAAGLSDEVDVVVGTLGKALGSYGAYVCAGREIVEYLVNTARPFIFSTAPPPPGRRRRDGGAGAARSPARTGSSGCGRTRRRCARRWRREGLAVGGSETQIVPVEVGDAERTMELCERILERGVFAQGIRPPTVPEGTSRLRFTVMATHRAGELRRAAKLVGAAAPGAGHRRLERRPAAGRRRLAAECAASSSPAPAPRSARPWWPPSIARTLAATGARVAVFKPAVTGLDDPGEPDHELLRRAAGSTQSDEEIAPYRYGPPSPRTSRRRLAGEEIDPERLLAAACAAAGERRRARLRGGRRPARPARPRLPGPRPRRRPGAAAGRRRLSRPRHDQPHAADDRGRARRRPRGRGVVLTPWPESPSRIEESNRETIAALGEVRVETLPPLDLADPGSWPALPLLPSRLSGLPLRPDRRRRAITAPVEGDRRPETLIAWPSASTKSAGVAVSGSPTAPWKIAPVTATPRLPPIMRNIESTPEAIPAFSTGTAFIAALVIGDIVSAIPTPSSMNPGSRSP